MSRVWAVLASALFALPLLATLRQPDTPWPILAGLLFVFALSLARPAWGLLVVAGLLPVAPAMALIAERPSLPEEFLVAFLVAAGLRLATSRSPAPSRLAWPAAVFALAAAASLFLELSALQQVTSDIRPFTADLWGHLTNTYFTAPMPEPFQEFFFWTEALALAVLADAILRRTPAAAPSAVRMLVAGGTGFAAFSALRLSEIALRADAPWAAAAHAMWRLRFNSFLPDINAAGSLYALFLVPLVWLAWRGRRITALAAALVVALALWLAGLRAAIGGAAAGLGLTWLSAARPGHRVVLVTAVAGLAAVFAVATFSPRNVAVSSAAFFRLELTKAAFRMTADAPVFGVGLNRFKPVSRGIVSDEWKRRFSKMGNGENAHNNLLQILAELGLIGLGAFLWLMAPLVSQLRTVARAGPAAPETFALAGGVAAFLLSALLGQPLMLEQVRWIFFLALGLATGASATALTRRSPGRWMSRLGAVVLVAIVAATPVRLVRDRRDADLDGTIYGASDEKGPIDDIVYRRAAQRSSWFLASGTRTVHLALRVAPESAAACPVAIALDGHPADSVAPTRDAWMTLDIDLTSAPPGRRWRRLDLTTGSDACGLLVGALVERR